WSEDGKYFLYPFFSCRFFFPFLPLFFVALLLCVLPMLHLKPESPPFAPRVWPGVAPGTRLYRFSSRSGLTAIFFFSSLPATL
ncbi:hypothetical protein, partial [Enterobacter hormaechei]|uniref:hypothetical protein n=1 Tax=Enterobacter hormaechei TaxID=158836 RepID=UPI002E2DE977